MRTWSWRPSKETAGSVGWERSRSQYSRMGTANTLITVPSARRRWWKTSHSRETAARKPGSPSARISSFPAQMRCGFPLRNIWSHV